MFVVRVFSGNLGRGLDSHLKKKSLNFEMSIFKKKIIHINRFKLRLYLFYSIMPENASYASCGMA